MKRFLTLAMIAATACGEPGVRAPTPQPTALVGVRTIEVAPRDRPAFRAHVWYPTSSGTPQAFHSNQVIVGYRAVPDGALAAGSPAPLVILMHGSGGGGEGMAWIAVELAARGAIAVAADHPASTGGDGHQRSILDVWEQPADARATIDHLLASDWSARIDRGRIAVVGFSLGGLSAMLLAGARLEIEKLAEFCKTHHDGLCDGVAPYLATFDAAFYARANADHSDKRIRAAVALAPGATESMTATSLESLAPTLLVGLEHDQQLPPETHLRPMLAHLRPPSRYLEIAGAQHYSMLFVCRDNAAAVLREVGEDPVLCEDKYGRTREQIHAEVNAAIVKFLGERGVL
jgi:predicted dienelactone hydrolase